MDKKIKKLKIKGFFFLSFFLKKEKKRKKKKNKLLKNSELQFFGHIKETRGT